MLTSIIIEPDIAISKFLKKKIKQHSSNIEITATAHSLEQASTVINSVKPHLIISEVDIEGEKVFKIFRDHPHRHFEAILLADNTDSAPKSFNYPVSGFLLKPLQEKELLISLKKALEKIELRALTDPTDNSPANSESLPHHKIIGIPTMEGFEFLNVAEIIRCEGLQKCTRVITTLQSDIVSSYNIGKFRTLLKGYGFFSCHKSHLINLSYVRKYTHEGFIYLKDQSVVPLARRRKSKFLSYLHLL